MDLDLVVDEYAQKFHEFIELDIKGEDETYESKIMDLVGEKKHRLVIQMSHLRQTKGFETYVKNPVRWIVSWEEELNKFIGAEYGEDLKDMMEALGVETVRFHIGVDGNMGTQFISPRHLKTKYLNTLVCVEGIITRISLVTPRVLKSVHYSKKENEMIQREYRDETSLEGNPTVQSFPKTAIINGEKVDDLDVEYGLCEYKDTQKLFLQEMPENAPPGQLPRSIGVIVEDDLVDRFKPGDRVKVYGVYRCLPLSMNANFSFGMMRTTLSAINVTFSSLKDDKTAGADVRNFRRILAYCQKMKIPPLEYLSKSIAPSIWGHWEMKKALLLQLVGGDEKQLSKTHLRGDIHLLFCGDPSTAKSQFLRFAMNLSPISISTTGKASSGVGLTAAVVFDQESKENTLAAGAMVLGDRGIVCVDEFDKMNPQDRTAMHEVMEQQTVTIQKAGVHATLNARCSILAAANPIYGNYDRKLSIQRNIGLPDSLLSRFDLIFIVLDKKDPDLDMKIARHIMSIQKNFLKGQGTGNTVKKDIMRDEGDETDSDSDSDSDDDDDEERDSKKFQKSKNSNEMLTGMSMGNIKIHDITFLRKIVKYLKQMKRPKITDSIVKEVAEKYNTIREKTENLKNTLKITPRMVETLLRLSTASAKLRLSGFIESSDVQIAYDLLSFTIFRDEKDGFGVKDLKNSLLKKRSRKESEKSEEKEESGDDKKGKNEKDDEMKDEDDDSDSEDDDLESYSENIKSTVQRVLKEHVKNITQSSEETPISFLLKKVNSIALQRISERKLIYFIEHLAGDDQYFVNEGTVFRLS